MYRQHAATARIAAMAADAVVVAATYLAVLAVRDQATGLLGLPPLSPAQYTRLLWLLVPAWVGALAIAGSYRDLRRASVQVQHSRVLRGVGLGFVAVVLVLYAVHAAETVSRSLLFGFALASAPALYACRRAMVWAARRWFSQVARQRVLVIGDGAAARTLLERLAEHPEWGVEARVVADADELDRAVAALEVDHVLVATEAGLPRIADTCERAGVKWSVTAGFVGVATSRVDLDDLDGVALLTFSRTPANAEALVAKRAMDIVLAGLALVATAPLLAFAALLIRLEDGGPVLFAQRRCGLHGRPFTLHKLRSMRVGAEHDRQALAARNEMTGPVFKIRDDPRVTRVGRWLRRTSIDELPQLLNVIRGEMSLVGPRPPLPDEVARYERWQLRRLSMRPGLTCTWQVSGRSDVDFDRWMAMDLEYIDNWSLGADVGLLVRTVPAILRGWGAH